jgi:hypothetical protein
LVRRGCDRHHRREKSAEGRQRRRNAHRANEMGADIAANPHYPVSIVARPFRFIPNRWPGDQQPAKRCVAARAGSIRRWFGRPPFGGRPHPESPSSSGLRVRRSGRRPSDGLLSRTRSGSPQLVGIAAFRDRAIGQFPRQPARSLLASLATTLRVPAVRRLCRPMI